jgi:hypothetical protein
MILTIPYAAWKAIAQAESWTSYHHPTTGRANWFQIYAGTVDYIITTRVNGADYTDWSTNFPGSVLKSTEDDCVAGVLQEQGTARSVSGDVAHDDADSGAPVKIGGKGTAATPLAVDDGDRVDASFDLQGRLRTTATVDIAGDSADLDSGAGTDDHEVFAIGLPGAGGHVIGGTPADPLRTDPTGTTTQPVSDGGGSLTVDGPLTDTELRASAVPVSAASLPLPAGAATETTLASFLSAFNAEDFATQTTLASLLAAFGAEDFSTETTLAALLAAFSAEDFATQTTLAALLAAFGSEDFASETTLAAFRADFNAEDFASETTLAAFAAAFGAEDFASETTLAALSAAFTAEDFASETTLAALSTKIDDGSQIAQAVGDVAHDAADSGAPVKIGGTATELLPVAVDEGDRVQASLDLQGRVRGVSTLLDDDGNQVEIALGAQRSTNNEIGRLQPVYRLATETSPGQLGMQVEMESQQLLRGILIEMRRLNAIFSNQMDIELEDDEVYLAEDLT